MLQLKNSEEWKMLLIEQVSIDLGLRHLTITSEGDNLAEPKRLHSMYAIYKRIFSDGTG
ncbi:hypothetical protein [Paenibacillus sp. 8b26]|uniref:hypothetical protein n=1 Tax=Paenibacillus sp. 8b26 TaxID=3424133 RepID=UPI003D6587DC